LEIIKEIEVIHNPVTDRLSAAFFMKKARIPRSVNGDEWRFSFLTAFKKVAGFP